MRSRRLLVPVAAAALVLAWAEWAHWRASGRRLGTHPEATGREAIVVLGFRNRGTRANYLNRYRVRAALRSIDPAAASSVLVFCGGAVASDVPEAELMLRYAREALGFTGSARVDAASTTTWRNIENAVPLLEGFDSIKIVSNPLHAEQARAYLWKQRPDLAQRLVRARDYRLGEILPVKPLAAVVGLWNLRKL
jgi:uncharacterized SAM-binding protein YcdF (DUF218 family)